MNDESHTTPSTDTMKRILQMFCRHLVGLSVTYRHKAPTKSGEPLKVQLYSGTVISVRGIVFYLTAGHALKNLIANLEQIKIDAVRLVDTLGTGAIDRHMTIPIALDRNNSFFIDDDDLGLDFGLVALGANAVELLIRNGIIILDEPTYTQQQGRHFSAYKVLGFPEERADCTVSPLGEVSVTPTLLSISKCDDTIACQKKTKFERFRGRIDQTSLNSVVGMSGGPIFGISRNKPVKYWIIAIQSSWVAETKIIFGCQMPTLTKMIGDHIDEAKRQDALDPITAIRR